MKASRRFFGFILVCGLSPLSAFGDVTLFMGAQGDPPVPAAATMYIPQGGTTCVNFYMRSDTAFSSANYQIRFLATTSSGVTEDCASAQIDVTEPSYPGYTIPIIDISGCPPAVREGALGGTHAIAANTNYYIGEVCFDATASASGTTTITYDSNSGQTFVTNASFVNVPISNRFGGTLEVAAPIPAVSTWGLASLAVVLLIAGTVLLRRRVAM